MRPGRLVALVALGLLASCSTSAPATPGSAGQQVTVFAAASLKSTFTDLGTQFEQANPGTEVNFNFDGSANLLDQLSAGAPADVLATADRSTMEAAISEQVVDSAATSFATNVLTLIVPPGNPAGITGLDDSLGNAKLVVCEARVPCGAATVKLADRLGVDLAPVSEESSVAGVRTKVESGQADAGIVYVTDASDAAGKVEQITINRTDEVKNEYLISTAKSATAPELAAKFISFVEGDQGHQVLAQAGFGSAG